MIIKTSFNNLDMVTTFDNLHPLKQLEECNLALSKNETIITYSSFIIEWASAMGIKIVDEHDVEFNKIDIMKIFDEINKTFDMIDNICINNFKK